MSFASYMPKNLYYDPADEVYYYQTPVEDPDNPGQNIKITLHKNCRGRSCGVILGKVTTGSGATGLRGGRGKRGGGLFSIWSSGKQLGASDWGTRCVWRPD